MSDEATCPPDAVKQAPKLPLAAQVIDQYRAFCNELIQSGLLLPPSDRIQLFRTYLWFKRG